MNRQNTYKDAGVDIELGDEVSKILYNAAKQTWVNREGKLGEVIVPFDDFSGIRAIYLDNLPKGTLMNIGLDGVGTKIELAERMNDHSSIAYDLFAMICDDALVRGAEPVLVGSILDVNSFGRNGESHIEQVKQLAEGYVNAANAANVAVINGEAAELGDRVSGYGSFNYNWGGVVVWFANKDRMLTGKEIRPGDSLVGLGENGFRSNGLSLVRKIMEDNHGKEWHNIPWENGNYKLGLLASSPSRIYTKTIIDMIGGHDKEPKVEVHGIAHITGGGLPGKLERVLKPSGLGAYVHSPIEPTRFMLYTQALGKVSDEVAYKTWNMGQGMVVITPNPEGVLAIARNKGILSQVIGEVIKTNEITITNKGVFAPYRNQDLTEETIYQKGPEKLVFNI